MHIFEDHRDRLPTSTGALRAWSRLLTFHEGAGIPREAIARIGTHVILEGFVMEGVVVFLIFDAWLREQDWEMLRGEGCALDNTWQMALRLGRRHRGDKVKTGSDQGVIIANDWVRDMISVLKSECGDEELLLPLAQHRFCRIWWKTLRDLGIENMGPPHNRTCATQARPTSSRRVELEAARRKGRWASLSSVQRYTKAFWLVERRAALRRDLLRHGAHFWQRPRAHIIAALTSSRASSSHNAQQLAQSLARSADEKPRRGAHLTGAATEQTPFTNIPGIPGARVRAHHQRNQARDQRRAERLHSP